MNIVFRNFTLLTFSIFLCEPFASIADREFMALSFWFFKINFIVIK